MHTLFRAMPAGRPRPVRARPVRRLPRHRRRRRGLDHRDLRRAAPGDRQLALVGRAVLHPHRQVPAGHADRAAAGLPATAAPRLPRRARARARARCSSSSSSTRPPACGCSSRPSAADAAEPEQISLDMEFADEGGEGPTPVRGAAARRHARRRDALHAPGRRRGGLADHAAAARRPAAGAPVREGLVGAAGGRRAAGRRTAAGTSRGWRHERAVERHGKAARPRPQSAAAPSPFPPIAEYAFLSDCHTGALVAPDGGDRLAVRAALRRAERVRRRCSTARRATSASARSGSTSRPAGATSRARTSLDDDLAHPERLGRRARRADDGPAPRARTRSRRTRGRRPTTTPSTCSSAPSRCIDGSVEIELVCEPVFDYGRVPGRVGARRRRPPRRRRDAGRSRRSGCSTDMALGIEGNRVRARHMLHGGRASSTARSRGPRASPPRPTSTTPTRGSTRRRASGARGSPAPACPTTTGRRRSSARRWRSRA